MVSVVIPSRNERFLQPTINDLLKNARGEVEIIAVLDGYWPSPDLEDDPRVRLVHRGESKGMRAAINAGFAIARGDFFMKIDAHCMVSEGWDLELAESCKENYVVTPRRKRLDAEKWEVQDVGKPDVDYMYVSYPVNPLDFGGPGLNGRPWDEKNADESLKSIEIDDLMSSQGSCWFIRREYYHELELMDEESYGPFWNESQEVMFKCWLSGGRCIVNKRAWYAHLHKGTKYGRGYQLDEDWLQHGARFTKNWMIFKKAWDKQTLPLEWLIEKFWPVPGWPENWREILKQVQESGVADLPENQIKDPKKKEKPMENVESNTVEPVKNVQSGYKPLSFTPTKIVEPTVVPGRRDKLVQLFADKGFTRGAEIGVSGGRFSEQMWKGIPGLHLTGVDPYSTYEGYKWGGRQERHDNHRNEAMERYNQYGGFLMHEQSMKAVKHVPLESLDFVYIDGNHEFDYVMQDIIEWSKRVRPGGIVAGHDYFEFRHAGVVDAVRAYVKAHGIKEWFINTERETSWWFVKP